MGWGSCLVSMQLMSFGDLLNGDIKSALMQSVTARVGLSCHVIAITS